MKRLFVSIVILCMTVVCVMARTKGDQILTAEEMPAAELLLPAPPTLTSPMYHNDFVQYQKGKELRNTERGALAVEDAQKSVEYFMERFGKAMGREMTPDTYPAVAEFIETTFKTARLSIQKAKDGFQRERPYSQFKEQSGVPEDEYPDDIYHSYPSGHTIRAWSIALALVGLDPAHQNEILKTGYEIGQSRVIVGFHYQSDVDAARLVAGAAFARMVAEPAWQKLFQKAREEFNKAPAVASLGTDGQTDVNNVSQEVKSNNNYNGEYTLNGLPATSNSHGIVIKDGRKEFRK